MSKTSSRRLYRSADDRVLAGVCGGIAEHFGIDSTLVRVVTVVLTIASIGLPMPLIYLVLAVVTPRSDAARGELDSGSVAPPTESESDAASFSAQEIEAWGLEDSAVPAKQEA